VLRKGKDSMDPHANMGLAAGAFSQKRKPAFAVK
jgi:hypothetical protein